MQLDDKVALHSPHKFQLVHEIADGGLPQVQHFLYLLYRVELLFPAEMAPGLRLPDLAVAAPAEHLQQIEIVYREGPRAGRLLSFGCVSAAATATVGRLSPL